MSRKRKNFVNPGLKHCPENGEIMIWTPRFKSKRDARYQMEKYCNFIKSKGYKPLIPDRMLRQMVVGYPDFGFIMESPLGSRKNMEQLKDCQEVWIFADNNTSEIYQVMLETRRLGKTFRLFDSHMHVRHNNYNPKDSSRNYTC